MKLPRDVSGAEGGEFFAVGAFAAGDNQAVVIVRALRRDVDRPARPGVEQFGITPEAAAVKPGLIHVAACVDNDETLVNKIRP